MPNPLKVAFFVILLIRIYLFFIPGFQIDVVTWQAWAQRLTEGGPSNFYSDEYYSLYFPGYLYILWPMGEIFHVIFPQAPFTSFLFEIFSKSITTFFDLAASFYVYKIVSKHRSSFAIPAALFYFANPAVIFNTSIWGQIDGIMIFLLLYSSYFLIEKKKLFLSSLGLSLSILIKPQTLAILPIVFIKNLKMTFAVFLLILFSIPFFPTDPFLGLFKLGLKLNDQYPYSSLFAFNLWGLLDWWKLDNKVFLVFSYRTWGIIIYSLSLIVILIPILKEKFKNSSYFYLGIALSFMAFYLFPTRIHERYLLPFLAFILIFSIIKKSKLLIGTYFVSSLIHLVNLWYVYYYYNFVYIDQKFADNLFYTLVNNNFKIFSMLMLILFGVLLIFYYRSIYVKK